MAARHGTRSKYNEGCRCESCSLAEANYQKTRRHGTAKVTHIRVGGDTLNGRVERGPGPMELALNAVVANVPTADKRPDLVEGARAMARILDNPLTVSQQPQALARYHEAMEKLLKGTEKKSKLAAVRLMTAPTKTAAG